MIVDALESKVHKGFSRIAAHQLTWVVEGQIVAVVLHFDPCALAEAWRGAIEGQTDGIQDGGFARSGLAGNQKYITFGQGGCAEVNPFILYRGDIIDM